MTSQTWANWYLNPLDHFIMDYKGFGAYVRYVDDFVVFCNDKEALQSLRKQIEECLGRLRLTLHPTKSRVYKTSDGVPFLGFCHYPTHSVLLKPGLRRFKRRIREKMANPETGAEAAKSSVGGWSGFARMGDTYKLREALHKRFVIKGTGERLPRVAWGLVEQQQRQQFPRRQPQQQHSGQQEQQQWVPGGVSVEVP